jgi:hypothetical protein
MPPRNDPTPKAFLVWLREAANRLSKQKPWPKGATRFGYFQSEVCWNLSRAEQIDHYDRLTFSIEDFESSYKSAHEKGDSKAIFAFAKDNREALTRPWITRQLVEWRLDDSRKSKRYFDRFMQIYWSQQGTRKGKTMIAIIRRDQAVYAASLRHDPTKPKKGLLFDLADRFPMSQDSIKDVLKFYGQFYERWRTLPDTRIYLSLRQ